MQIKKLSKADADLIREVDSKVPTDYLYELKEEKGGYVTANRKESYLSFARSNGVNTTFN